MQTAGLSPAVIHLVEWFSWRLPSEGCCLPVGHFLGPVEGLFGFPILAIAQQFHSLAEQNIGFFHIAPRRQMWYPYYRNLKEYLET